MQCKKMQLFFGETCIFLGEQLASAQTPRSRRNLEGQQSELLDFVGSIFAVPVPQCVGAILLCLLNMVQKGSIWQMIWVLPGAMMAMRRKCQWICRFTCNCVVYTFTV